MPDITLTAQVGMRLASISIFGYDYVVTLPSEYRLYQRQNVWYRPSLACVLFALARYVGLVYVCYATATYFDTHANLSHCQAIAPVGAFMRGMVSTTSAFVFMWRTWAIWGRSRPILLTMAIALIPVTLFSYCSAFLQKGTLTDWNGCTAVAGASSVFALKWPFALVNLLYDALACGLSTIRLLRNVRGGVSPISGILMKDGLGYFIVVVVLHVVNLQYLLSPDPAKQGLMMQFQAAMCSILAQRIITSLSERVTNKSTSHSESTRDRSKSKSRGRSLSASVWKKPPNPNPPHLVQSFSQNGQDSDFLHMSKPTNMELGRMQIAVGVDRHVHVDGDEEQKYPGFA